MPVDEMLGNEMHCNEMIVIEIIINKIMNVIKSLPMKCLLWEIIVSKIVVDGMTDSDMTIGQWND